MDGACAVAGAGRPRMIPTAADGDDIEALQGALR